MTVAALRQRFSFVDGRKLLAVGLAALAATLVLVITRPEPSVSVLVAGRDLTPGAPLTAADIAVRQVDSASGLVAGSSLGELEGWVLAAPIAAGEPLLPSLLAPPEIVAADGVMALPVEEGHAALGRISSGDEIDIYATFTGATGEPGTTSLLAEGVYVVEVDRNEAGLGTGDVRLLLAVDDELAASLTNAIRTGAIDVVKRMP